MPTLYPQSLGELIMTHPYSRRTFLEASLITGVLAATLHLSRALVASHEAPTPPKPNFRVTDYHVHLSNTLTIDQALQLGKDRGVHVGIVEHPGEGFPIHTDAELQKYIDGLRKYPVHIGLQPVYTGWSKAFSKQVLDQLDYVLMDALTLPNRRHLARHLGNRHHGRRRRSLHAALHAIH